MTRRFEVGFAFTNPTPSRSWFGSLLLLRAKLIFRIVKTVLFMDAAQLYLNLIKRTLSYSLWEDPGRPVETFTYKLPLYLRLLIKTVVAPLRKLDLQLVRKLDYGEEERKVGAIWPSQADTMIGLKRLDNIQFCVETVLRESIPGDIIETGVWRGGASILMRAILAAHNVQNRRVFVADSFQGLPEPDLGRYPQDKGDTLHKEEFLAVSQEQVAANFKKYGLLDEQVVFLKGWFKDTLPAAPITQLAVMRLDGDMYASTMDALNALYPKLSKGGFCIIDDYALEGCKKAVDDYRDLHKINCPLIQIDITGHFWRKD